MLARIRLLLVSLSIAVISSGCDEAVPPPEEPAAEYPLTLDLVRGYSVLGDGARSEAAPSECRYRVGDTSYPLDSASLRLTDAGAFTLRLTARTSSGEAHSDPLRIEGTVERQGALVRFSPSGPGGYAWFGTFGPSPGVPTTITLADHSRGETPVGIGSTRCTTLAFATDLAALDLATTGGTSTDTYRLTGFFPLPLSYGRLGNNRYDSARLDFGEDGEYRFTLWRLYGNPYDRGDTTYVERVSRGRYIREGDLYAIDPGTPRASFGVVSGREMVLHRNYQGARYWGLDHSASEDLAFVRE